MELALLKFIKTHKNWEQLLQEAPYCLKISRDDPYIMFKYNMIESDFSLPEVKEARGIIFREDNWKPVCVPFFKFMNAEEPQSDLDKIDWATASVQEKIDGCFSKKDCVMLADGSKKPISEIVNNKLSCEVLSYNMSTGKIEPKRVVGWKKKRNGPGGVRQQEWLTIKLRGVKQALSATRISQHSILTVTKNHMIFALDKATNAIIEKPADELTTRDIVFTATNSLSEQELQVSLGTLLGDGSLTYLKQGANSGLAFSHSLKQESYARWKASLLHSFSPRIRCRTNVNSYGKTRITVNSNCSSKFTKLKSLCYVNNKKQINIDWLSQLGDLGFAIWYMDDGYLNKSAKNNAIGLSTEGFSLEEVKLIVEFLASKGLTAYIKSYRGLYGLTLSTKASEQVWQRIRKFIPDCMQYKLPNRHRGYFDPTVIDTYKPVRSTVELIPAMITDITTGICRSNIDGTAKYDIEVEDNHNYFCGGILVHNSLIKCWFDDTWHVSTNGTIDAFKANLATDVCPTYKTFGDLFVGALPYELNDFFYLLEKNYTYMFELVSPYNKVIIRYPQTKLYLLGARNLDTLQEVLPEDTVLYHRFDIPKRYKLNNYETVRAAVDKLNSTEELSHEGFVVCSTSNFARVKVKSLVYVTAHHLANNGVITNERLVDIILAGEISEFSSYFPEYLENLTTIANKIDNFKNSVRDAILTIKPEQYSEANRKQLAEKVLRYPKNMQQFIFRYNEAEENLQQLSAKKWCRILGLE